MIGNFLSLELDLNSIANKALKTSALFWFVTTVFGQWLFAFYVMLFYGGAAVRGDLAAWNQVLPHGIIVGDPIGNFALASHLFLAMLIMVGGPLQLLPQLRTYAPNFHRWNGRVYLLTVFLSSLGGLFLVWNRESGAQFVRHVGISLDALLIMLFAVLTLRYALSRNIAVHQHWALRLFIVVSGVWYFRVGLMFWLGINNGPVGFNPATFTGPFLDFLSFADYLLPLALLELYFRVEQHPSAVTSSIAALGLFMLTIATAFGLFVATKVLWLPRLQ